jgi:hypothetical protein
MTLPEERRKNEYLENDFDILFPKLSDGLNLADVRSCLPHAQIDENDPKHGVLRQELKYILVLLVKRASWPSLRTHLDFIDQEG